MSRRGLGEAGGGAGMGAPSLQAGPWMASPGDDVELRVEEAGQLQVEGPGKKLQAQVQTPSRGGGAGCSGAGALGM